MRLARTAAGVEAMLVHEPEPEDTEFQAGTITVLVEEGLQGLVDVEEPHDRLVLRPTGSAPNPRGSHGA